MNKFSIAPVNYSKRKPNVFSLFDEVFGKDMEHFIGRDQKNSIPAVNISSSDEGYLIELAAPGFQKSDFNLSVEDLTLNLSTAPKTEEDTKKYTRREFNYGSFSRTFTLPEDSDAASIKASYEGGILALSIPKLPEAKKKMHKIKIK